MSYSMSSIWGHSVHFAKFLVLRFSKHVKVGYSQSFHGISTKLYGDQGGIPDNIFCDLPYLKKVAAPLKISHLG